MNPAFCELRLYQVAPGRMDDMVDRLRGPLQILFARHGIRPVASWHTVSGPDHPVFIYLMNWASLDERSRAWGGFYADPEWQEARERTNRGSELVERYALNFLRPIQAMAADDVAAHGTHELLLPEIAIGKSARAQEEVSHLAAALSRIGARLLGAYECMTGDDLPRAALFVSWPDDATRRVHASLFERHPLGRAQRYQLERL